MRGIGQRNSYGLYGLDIGDEWTALFCLDTGTSEIRKYVRGRRHTVATHMASARDLPTREQPLVSSRDLGLPERASQANEVFDSGSSLILLAVAAKMAFARAGATRDTPGSPTPAGGALLSITWTLV